MSLKIMKTLHCILIDKKHNNKPHKIIGHLRRSIDENITVNRMKL